MSEYNYYFIRQKINDQFYSSTKIPCPVNEKLLKDLLKTYVGHVQVWMVDSTDNSKENLTQSLGNTHFNLYDFAKHHEEELRRVRIIYKLPGGGTLNEPFYFYTLNSLIDQIPKKFFVAGTPCSLAVRVNWGSSWKLTEKSDSKSNTRKITAGEEYEKFIGRQYEDQNFDVLYNGIEKGVEDNGIDLVCKNEDKLILVQCKNWITLENFKVSSKDIRAFLGDCYAYLITKGIKNCNVGFHFIVSDEEMLDQSARNYLKASSIIKYKTVPFNKKENG